MGRLEGRVCIVTESASGIGRAVAAAMVAEGGTVAGLDLHDAAPEGVLMPIVCDVSDPAGVDHAVAAVVERQGRVDVLVNAAGIHRPGTVMDTDPAGLGCGALGGPARAVPREPRDPARR